MSPARFPRGFTLIEMVITVALVGLLATMVVPIAELAVKRSKEIELRLALRDIRRAIDAYKKAVDEGRVIGKVGDSGSGYPPALGALVDGAEDARSPEKRKIYFLRRLPRDPMLVDASRPAPETWGLRSYASEPDAPAEGADVFDVYSTSSSVGINGVAYTKW
jgi:general secretion pathway protein G